MKRAFEFTPTDQEAMVSRILVLTHQAIDEAFPEARPAPHRFAKTVFGDEPTASQILPGDPHQWAAAYAEEPARNNHELSRPKPLAISEEQPEVPVSNKTDPGHEDTTTFRILQRKRLTQTVVGCVVLIVGFVIGYFLW